MFKHICPACDGRGYAVEELPLAPAVQRDHSMDYRDVACRLLDKLEREGWRPDEVAAMTARIAELDGADLFDRIQTPAQASTAPSDVSEHIDAARLKRELKAMPQCSGPPRSAEGFEADPPPDDSAYPPQREVGGSNG